ncbi:MAG: HipA domain-containing protein [Desulfobacteraceae bacterium]|nr:HipA domain-containing protein [Desulfobacteraceae bacterium]
MTEPFQILELQSDSPEVIEQLGSKPKFWFRLPNDTQPWLFKYTRDNTGEDWSEKIASELARLLKIPAAQVELATFMGKRGCASRSFVETKRGYELIHGSEVLAGRITDYEKSKQWGQSDHCIKNIITAVELVFPQSKRSEQLRILAGYIVLDALICNTDRHHDNWGLLRWISRGKTIHSIAPSFDHASSLGRELQDDRRKRILLEPKGIERYVLHARGGIYWDAADAKGDNPLLLAQKTAKSFPEYFSHSLQILRHLSEEEMIGIVERIPVIWMNATAKEFCCRMLAITKKQLNEVQL